MKPHLDCKNILCFYITFAAKEAKPHRNPTETPPHMTAKPHPEMRFHIVFYCLSRLRFGSSLELLQNISKNQTKANFAPVWVRQVRNFAFVWFLHLGIINIEPAICEVFLLFYWSFYTCTMNGILANLKGKRKGGNVPQRFLRTFQLFWGIAFKLYCIAVLTGFLEFVR